MIISKTPLRISFAGGGTDMQSYYQTGYGAVVSMAISKYIYVAVHRRFDDSIRISYTDTEIVDCVDEIQHSIVRECLKMVGIPRGVEITTIGEVPAGTGLGSSSSLTVGLLNALYAFIGVQLSANELMERACQIEIQILKSPIGKQDQSAAAFGGINYFKFHKDETVTREKLWLSDSATRTLEHNLMVFYTGMQRDANVILAQQKKDTASKLAVLDCMREQANELRTMLLQNNVGPDFGRLLHEGWLKKRSVTGSISNSRIDELYETARKAGAVGGKLLGAGGGGFLLVYCEEPYQKSVQEALGLQRMYLHIARYGSRIVYFNG